VGSAFDSSHVFRDLARQLFELSLSNLICYPLCCMNRSVVFTVLALQSWNHDLLDGA
jgi:hypothetical protein